MTGDTFLTFDKILNFLAGIWDWLTTTHDISDNVLIKVIVGIINVLNPLNWGQFESSETFMNLINTFNPIQFIVTTGVFTAITMGILHLINPLS